MKNYPERLLAPITNFDKSSIFGINKDSKKRGLISEHLMLHKLDPGPIYNIGLDMTKKSPIKTMPPSVKISKGKTLNFIELAVKDNKHSPGVGRYNLDKKLRINGNYTSKAPKSEFYDDAAFKSLQTPFAYPEVKLEKYKMKGSINWKI